MPHDPEMIRQAAREAVVAVARRAVRDDQCVVSTGIVDSLSLLNLIALLEKKLQIRIPTERVQPEDFLKYGLIPEFIGRLPVVATLDELDERALVKILTEPRNALTKQYEKLLSFEKVKLKFTEGALGAVARKAFTQKTGARGLRAILEEVMLDVMYDAPSQKQIKEVLITEDSILGKHPPIRIFEQDKDIKTA